MELENLFKSTLKNSRVLGDTTFVIEPIIEFEEKSSSQYHNNVDFSIDKYSIAPNGGAIAIAHEKNRDSNGYYDTICIYDSYSNLIQVIPIDIQANLRHIYFTPEECIILVFSNSTIVSYQLRGMKISENILYDNSNLTLNFASFWARGLFIIGTNNKIYIIDDLATLKPHLFCYYAGSTLLDGIAIPGDLINNISPMLWCYNADGEIILIQENSYDKDNFPYPITGLSFSPDYSMVLVKCDTRYFFCEPNFTKIILNVNFDDIESDKIFWCGNDSILIVKDTLLSMFGATNDAIKWELNSNIAIISETDGARVFTKKGIYLLRALIPSVLEFSLWNLKAPQVKLFLTLLDDNLLAMKSPLNDYTTDEILLSIQSMFDAAIFFRNYEQRYSLMKAISRIQVYSKNPEKDGSEESDKLLQIKDFSQFADRLSTLRAVEQLVRHPYNIPMTVPQFNDITSTVLLKRLCNRSLHFEAYRIAQYLGVDTIFISTHWAHCLIMTKLPTNIIINKIKKMKEPIDYIDLATTAFEIKKNDLALVLLSENPAKARGVPLLINQKLWEQAIEAAINSYDTSLIIFALEKIKESCKIEIFDQFLEKNQILRDIWLKMPLNEQDKEKYLKLNKRDLLINIKSKLNIESDFEEVKKLFNFVEDSFNSKVIELFTLLEPIKKYLLNIKSIPNINNLTPVEIFEEIILLDDRKKILEVGEILGYTLDEILWRRLNFGIKNNNIKVLKSFYNDTKKKGVPERFLKFVQKKNNQNAIKILNGEEIIEEIIIKEKEILIENNNNNLIEEDKKEKRRRERRERKAEKERRKIENPKKHKSKNKDL